MERRGEGPGTTSLHLPPTNQQTSQFFIQTFSFQFLNVELSESNPVARRRRRWRSDGLVWIQGSGAQR